ncbi:hypothetical protein THTE_1661 [Thermogutta terrifontis]|uniref:Uncharacterized protein n=1 Tax=Thermogutta terrifontis TaxID=1331910 RepID=A0A286REA3_9BACT|nr:hypothetical protein THTE_1661 [Thermogutta terrifontis]
MIRPGRFGTGSASTQKAMNGARRGDFRRAFFLEGSFGQRFCVPPLA